MTQLKYFLFSAWLIIFFSPPAIALSYPQFPEFPSKSQPLAVSFRTEFFRSNANYTQFMKWNKLPSDSFFQYTAFQPKISYSPFPIYLNFSFFANGFFSSSPAGNYLQPTSLGGGLSFYRKIKNLTAGAELKGGAPLYGNFTKSSDKVIVGDGAYFAEPGLWLLFDISRQFYIYSRAAFRYRTSFLSGLLFWHAGGALRMRHIDAGGGVDSFWSVLPDGYASRPDTRWSLLKKVNGGSYKFYSVNPSVLSWTCWAEFKFKPFFATVYMNVDTVGINYAKGFNIGLITKFKWLLRSSLIQKKKSDIRFDFKEGYSSEGAAPLSKEADSYFDEGEDSYEDEDKPKKRPKGGAINEELKQELKYLKY